MNGKVFWLMMAVVVGGITQSAIAQEDLPLGKQLNVVIKDIILKQQADIDNFIFEHKLLMAETQEERLAIVEEKVQELRESILALNNERLELIEKMKNGEITKEEFVTEMHRIASEVRTTGSSMSIVGEELSQLNMEMSSELSQRGQTLAQNLQNMAQDLSQIGKSTSEEAREKGYNPPQTLQPPVMPPISQPTSTPMPQSPTPHSPKPPQTHTPQPPVTQPPTTQTPQPPTLNSPANGVTVKKNSIMLKWSGNSSSYRLQIALDPQFTNIVVDVTVTTTMYKPFLSTGTYYWRVSGDGGVTWSVVWSFTLN